MDILCGNASEPEDDYDQLSEPYSYLEANKENIDPNGFYHICGSKSLTSNHHPHTPGNPPILAIGGKAAPLNSPMVVKTEVRAPSYPYQARFEHVQAKPFPISEQKLAMKYERV